MDSLTQFVLGATVAHAGAGREAGRRAALVGGILGTLPDLDVLARFGDPVSDFTYHRGASHSLVVLTCAAPILAWVVTRLLRPPSASYRRWLATVWLVLVTHPLLDCFTIYGTQILWPITEHPFGLGSVFIIDPAYTLMLAIGLAVALVRHDQRGGGRRANAIGLAVSTAYLLSGAAAQAHVERFAGESLARQGIPAQRILALAAPFNALAWRVVVITPDAYLVAWHSLFAPAPDLRFARYPSERDLLAPIEDAWAVHRLAWFTHGFYAVERVDDEVRMSDLRMGVEPDRFAFTFAVARAAALGVEAIPPRRVRTERMREGDLGRIVDVILGAPKL